MALVPDDPKQQKALVAGIAFLAALYFGNSMWLGPKREAVANDEATLERLETSNRQASLQATQSGRDLEERMALYERHISQLELLIPGQDQIAQLWSSMGQLARQANVELQGLRPDGLEPVEGYTRETYEIRAVGEYHNVARFLTTIASMERIATPIDMDIQRFTENIGGFQQEYEAPVIATFRVQTYVIDDTPVLDVPPPLPGGDE